VSQYGPYLLEGQIVNRGRPSSTKGSIGCVSLVYQLFVNIVRNSDYFEGKSRKKRGKSFLTLFSPCLFINLPFARKRAKGNKKMNKENKFSLIFLLGVCLNNKPKG